MATLTEIKMKEHAALFADGLKRCGKKDWKIGDAGCGKIKSVKKFHVESGKPDGLSARCKECAREYNRTPKARRKQRAYAKKVNARTEALKRTPEGRAKILAYNKKPKVKAACSARNKVSRSKPAYFKTYAKQLSLYTEVRRSPENSELLQVKCMYCDRWTTPTRMEVMTKLNVIYGRLRGESNIYCNDDCKEACPTFRRKMYPKGFKPTSSRETSPLLRKMCFARDNYTCQHCDNTEEVLHCHHVEGVAHNPMVQLDIGNVTTLCKSCHIKLHKTPGCTFNDYKCNIQ